MSGNRIRRSIVLVLTLAVAASALLAMGHMARAQGEEERLITIDLRDATLDTALDAIFKTTPYSYVLASGVTGRVTMALNNVTFTQALRAILDMQNLTYRREGNVYYITQKIEQAPEQAPVIEEIPASQMNYYWFGPGGRYEPQCLDARIIASWFGVGWEAFMGIVPWPAESGGGTGGGGGGARGGGGGGTGGAGGGGTGGAGGGGGGRGGGGGGTGGGGGGRGGGGGGTGGGGGGRGGGGGTGGGGGGRGGRGD